MSGPDLLGALGALRRHPHADRATLRRWQDRMVRRLVAHAWDEVPFYRRLWSAHGVDPRAVRGAADLARLPIAEKRAMLEADPADLLARSARRSRLVSRTTSGSTGARFVVRRTWLEQNLLHLFRLRAAGLIGVRPGDHTVRVHESGRPVPNDSKVVGRTLGRLGLARRTSVSAYGQPDEIARRIAALGPDVLWSYPELLARIAAVAPTGLPQPRLVLTGGEPLTPSARTVIREAFGTTPRSWYGSMEFNLLAWECPASGLMHTNDDALVLEVLDPDGAPVAPGETGEVVATGLHSYAMPFIRYRQGDLAVRGEDACPCGAPFAALRSVDGRSAPPFALPGGRTLYPLQIVTALFDTAPWAASQQVIQERADRIVVRLVTPEPPTAAALDAARRSVERVVGDDVELGLELVPDLPREPSGKTRLYYSLVPTA